MNNKRPSTNTELAKERNRAAAERTLMAWIRTCLSLIGFGFGVDRIITTLQKSAVANYFDNPILLTRILGLSFIGIGYGSNYFGSDLEHRRELHHIKQKNYRYKPRSSLAFMVAISISVTGLFAFVGIFNQILWRLKSDL